MEKELHVIIPRYRQIAADIAAKIADRKYKVGDKVYSRSLIAAQYSVSPETARRAIAVLSDAGIVEAVKGSGVVIKSYKSAQDFVKLNQNINTVENLGRNTIDQVNALLYEGYILKDKIEQLVGRAVELRSATPFALYETKMPENSPNLGKSISQLNFWQNTSATVVAITREEKLLLSPGPKEPLLGGDTIYFVGDNSCFARVVGFLSDPQDSSSRRELEATEQKDELFPNL